MSQETHCEQRALPAFMRVVFSLWLCVVGGTAGACDLPSGPGDRTPPNLRVESPPAHVATAEIALSGSTEPGAQIQIDGGAVPAAGTADVSGAFTLSVRLVQNTENSLRVFAFDSAGNRSDPVTVTVEHDDVPPSSPEFHLAAKFVTNPAAHMTGVTEANAVVVAKSPVDSAVLVPDAAGRFSGSVDVAQNEESAIKVWARDEAGNAGQPASASVVHDDIEPSLTIEAPSGARFDVDGDRQVDIRLAFSDDGAGVDVSTLSVRNNRAIGGGESLGGVDAAVELRPYFTVTATNANYEASLAHEFPVGQHTLAVHVADSAGNATTVNAVFTVAGTEPHLSFAAPADWDRVPPPPDSFPIAITYGDTAGHVHPTSVRVINDRRILGLLQQDGTRPNDIAAGVGIGSWFNGDEASAETYEPGARYIFQGGSQTLTASVADRAGNRSAPDSLTFVASEPLPILMPIFSEAAAGASAHVVDIALVNLDDLGGVDFTIESDPDVITLDSLRTAGRVSFAAVDNADTNGETGAVTVAIFDQGGAPITAGQGTIIEVFVSVAADAPAGPTPLLLTDVHASTPAGRLTPIVERNGYLTVQ